ncbi:hypothetical protein [Agromyces bauzanensis]|uniref:hypothetical protein n=1 Tax=Agromyces bauzanensis TaxID=1308924 RepID=UPI00166A1B14|nr:hypothetical protein [Agromyces bauzanensis]
MIAMAVNAVNWGVGRAVGVPFEVRPEAGGAVGILLVVPTTLILFLASRHGRAGARSIQSVTSGRASGRSIRRGVRSGHPVVT